MYEPLKFDHLYILSLCLHCLLFSRWKGFICWVLFLVGQVSKFSHVVISLLLTSYKFIEMWSKFVWSKVEICILYFTRFWSYNIVINFPNKFGSCTATTSMLQIILDSFVPHYSYGEIGQKICWNQWKIPKE